MAGCGRVAYYSQAGGEPKQPVVGDTNGDMAAFTYYTGVGLGSMSMFFTPSPSCLNGVDPADDLNVYFTTTITGMLSICPENFEIDRGIINPNIAVACKLCDDGFISPASIPYTYSIGEYLPQCLPCNAGTYRSGNKTCSVCPVGKFSGIAWNNCESCPPTTTDAGGFCTNGTYSVICSPGSAYDSGLGLCVLCEKGYYSTNGTACIQCEPGLAAPFKGSENCTLCGEGQEVRDGDCVDCGDGFHSVSGSCVLCPAGTFCDTYDAIYEPQSCAGGQYAPPGSISCKECGIGRYSPDPSTPCDVCPAGYFSDETGSTNCELCPPGNYLCCCNVYD